MPVLVNSGQSIVTVSLENGNSYGINPGGRLEVINLSQDMLTAISAGTLSVYNGYTNGTVWYDSLSGKYRNDPSLRVYPDPVYKLADLPAGGPIPYGAMARVSDQGGSAGKIYTWDGVQWVSGSNMGVLAADASITSNTTLADITGLSIPIGLNETKFIRAVIPMAAALATTGFKISFIAPASSTMTATAYVTPDVVSTSALYVVYGTSGAFNFSAGNMTSAGTVVAVFDLAVATTTVSGTVKVQAAQSTSSGTALVLKQGAYITATKTA